MAKQSLGGHRSRFIPGLEIVPGYRLIEFLGKGGFGEVWKSTAPGGARVALKIIELDDRQGRKEFRAIRLIKNIRHPNLTPIIALWLRDQMGRVLDDGMADAPSLGATQFIDLKQELDTRPAELLIAMGLGDKSLHDLLKESRNRGYQGIPPHELLEYLHESARAIDFLNKPQHELDTGRVAIQHCDIKPQNIMLVGDSVQVCDFGLARALSDETDPNRNLKSLAGLSFTPAYAAPEILMGKGPTGTTDQYSLAVSYYELRTGRLPFPTGISDHLEVMKLHCRGQLDMSLLPEAEQAVLRRATAVKPTARYESATQLIRALQYAVGPEVENTSAGEQPVTSVNVSIEPGAQIGNGYTLGHPTLKTASGQIWEATDANGRPSMILIRDLRRSRDAVDGPAIGLFARLQHPNFSGPIMVWGLDLNGYPLGDWQRQLEAAMVGKLVVACRKPDRTLADRMKDWGTQGDCMPVDELLPIFKQVAAGLDYLNVTQHMVGTKRMSAQHMNVSPDTIVIEKPSAVWLAASIHIRGLERDSISLSGHEWLPPHGLLPPEFLQGRITRWSDQYSLALSYWYARTGTLPPDPNTPIATALDRVRKFQFDARNIPSAESVVLERALSRLPEQRFPNNTAFVAALDKAIEVEKKRQKSSASRPPSIPPAAGVAPASAPTSAGGDANAGNGVNAGAEANTVLADGLAPLDPQVPPSPALPPGDIEPPTDLVAPQGPAGARATAGAGPAAEAASADVPPLSPEGKSGKTLDIRNTAIEDLKRAVAAEEEAAEAAAADAHADTYDTVDPSGVTSFPSAPVAATGSSATTAPPAAHVPPLPPPASSRPKTPSTPPPAAQSPPAPPPPPAAPPAERPYRGTLIAPSLSPWSGDAAAADAAAPASAPASASSPTPAALPAPAASPAPAAAAYATAIPPAAAPPAANAEHGTADFEDGPSSLDASSMRADHLPELIPPPEAVAAPPKVRKGKSWKKDDPDDDPPSRDPRDACQTLVAPLLSFDHHAAPPESPSSTNSGTGSSGKKSGDIAARAASDEKPPVRKPPAKGPPPIAVTPIGAIQPPTPIKSPAKSSSLPPIPTATEAPSTEYPASPAGDAAHRLPVDPPSLPPPRELPSLTSEAALLPQTADSDADPSADPFAMYTNWPTPTESSSAFLSGSIPDFPAPDPQLLTGEEVMDRPTELPPDLNDLLSAALAAPASEGGFGGPASSGQAGGNPYEFPTIPPSGLEPSGSMELPSASPNELSPVDDVDVPPTAYFPQAVIEEEPTAISADVPPSAAAASPIAPASAPPPAVEEFDDLDVFDHPTESSDELGDPFLDLEIPLPSDLPDEPETAPALSLPPPLPPALPQAPAAVPPPPSWSGLYGRSKPLVDAALASAASSTNGPPAQSASPPTPAPLPPAKPTASSGDFGPAPDNAWSQPAAGSAGYAATGGAHGSGSYAAPAAPGSTPTYNSAPITPDVLRGSGGSNVMPPGAAAGAPNPAGVSSSLFPPGALRSYPVVDRGQPSRGPVFRSGQVIGPQCSLGQPRGTSGTDEFWDATGPGGKVVRLMIRHLPIDCMGGIDLDAINFVQSSEDVRHPNLGSVRAHWLLTRQKQWAVTNLDPVLYGGHAAALVSGTRHSFKTLAERLEECVVMGHGLPPFEALAYVRQIGDALDLMNLRQFPIAGRMASLLHLNVTPINICFSEDGSVRLTNPSFMRVLNTEVMSIDGPIWVPHHAYVPPEVLEWQVSRQSDQYSLALVYLHLRLGIRPPEMGLSMSTLWNYIPERDNERHLLLQALPRAESDALAKALQPRPAMRYPSCRTMVLAVERAVQSAPAPRMSPTVASLQPAAAPVAKDRELVFAFADGEASPEAIADHATATLAAVDENGNPPVDSAGPSPGGASPAKPTDSRAGRDTAANSADITETQLLDEDRPSQH